MDKPVSLSVKAWIIRNMSVRTMTQERTIETVINHQLESALTALNTCNSLEFSGFGRFLFNRPKALKKLEKMKSQIREYNRIINDETTTETRRKSIEYKLKLIEKSFDHLNKKLNGIVQDIRGMEEQTFSIEGTEGTDSKSE